jgi:autotransporter-associated beta strand protein
MRHLRRRTRLLQLEPLEARHLLATLYWLGTTNGDWNADNWTDTPGGTMVSGLVPSITNNDLRFDTTQLNFNNVAASFAVSNDIPDLTGLQLTINDASGVADFNIGGNAISLGAGGVTSTVSTGAGATLSFGDTGITLGAAQTFTSNTGLLTVSAAIDNGGDLLTISGTANTTLSGVISGAGGITKNDGGLLVLAGGNSYDGVTTINRGTLRITNPTALGSTVGGTVVNFNTAVSGGNGPALDVQNNIAVVDETLSLDSSSNYRTSLMSTGNNSWSGAITLKGNGLDQFWVSSGTFTISGPVTGSSFTGTMFVRGSGGTGILNNTINLGSGTFNKTDANTWQVNASGNVWGNTNVSVGTVQVGAAGAIPASTVLTMGQGDGSNATLNLSGFSQTISGLAFSSSGGTKAITSTAAATLTVDNAVARTYGGVLSGVGLALTKTGVGNLTLSGTNTFGGDTRIGAGSLILGNTLALQNSTVNLDAADTGSLSFGTLTAATFGGVKGTRDLALQNTTTAAVALSVGGNNQSTEYAGNLTGPGSLTKGGTGTLTLSGANTYTGVTAIIGGVLSVSSDGNLGTPPADAQPGSLILNAGTLQATAGFTLDSRRGIALGPASGLGTATILVAADQTLIYDGIMANQGSGTGNLTKTGAGLLALGGANTYGGSTTISAGRVQLTGGDDRLPTGTTVRLSSSGATLDLNGFDQTLGGLQSVFSGTGTTYVTGTTSTLTVGPTTLNFLVGANAGAAASKVTLDMSGLLGFSYHNISETGKFDVGPQAGSNLGGIVNLADTNTITASRVTLSDTYAGASQAIATQSAIYLGPRQHDQYQHARPWANRAIQLSVRFPWRFDRRFA